MGVTCRVLTITGGHRVDLDAWLGMLDAVCSQRGWTFAHAVQPAAQRWLAPEHVDAFDAVLLHDIPGLHLKRGEPPQPIHPSSRVREALRAFTDAGGGIVATHHSLAGWPSWDGWAHALGGRFHYAPGRLDGNYEPSSATVVDTSRVEIVDPGHPVCAGLESFELADERYLCPVFTDDVVPLLVTDGPLGGEHFISTFEHVLVGEDRAPRADAARRASRLLAWANSVGTSPLVYVQPGDSAATFARPEYRLLLGNSLEWVTSPAAREWATGRARPLDTSMNQEP